MTKRYFIDQIVLNAGSPNFESLLDAMYDSLNQLAAVKLYIDQVRPIVDQYHREEITLGKCTELLNELISTPSNPSPVTAEDDIDKLFYDSVDVIDKEGVVGISLLPFHKIFASVQQTGYSEAGIIDHLNAMCIESLSPEHFENWEAIKEQLKNNRNIYPERGITITKP